MWLDELWRRWIVRTSRRIRRQRHPLRTNRRVHLERLEDRTLLSGGLPFPTPSNATQLTSDISYADLNPASYTIKLESGVFYALDGELDIAANVNVTINGNSDTIERNTSASPFRLFDVANGGALTLNGDTSTTAPGPLTLSGGLAKGKNDGLGGAIYSSGTLSLSNVTVEGNSAVGGSGANGSKNAAGGAGALARGGGIYVKTGSISLTHDSFFGNTVRGGNGGDGGNGSGAGTKVGGGAGGAGGFGQGGGVFVSGGSATLTNDSFGNPALGIGNYAYGGNGGNGGNGARTNNGFAIGGRGGGGGGAYGGGLYWGTQGTPSLTLLNVGFTTNAAIGGNAGNGGYHANGGNGGNGQGGGLYVGGVTVRDAVSLSLNNGGFGNNVVQGGNAGNGGAAATLSHAGAGRGGDGGNGGAAGGGGLYAAVVGSVTLTNEAVGVNPFLANIARGGGGGSGGQGGDIVNSSHNNNNNLGGSGGFGGEADGGGVYLLAGTATLTNDRFGTSESNRASGGVGGGGNRANGGSGGSASGGGLFVQAPSVSLRDDAINNGSVTGGRGGDVFTGTGATPLDNAAGGSGGRASGGGVAIEWGDSGTVSVSDASFSNNHGTGGDGGSVTPAATPSSPTGGSGGKGSGAIGGGLFVGSSSIRLTNDTASGNSVQGGAGGKGGPGSGYVTNGFNFHFAKGGAGGDGGNGQGGGVYVSGGATSPTGGGVSPTSAFLTNDTLAVNTARGGNAGSGGKGGNTITTPGGKTTTTKNGSPGSGGNDQGGGLYVPSYENPTITNYNIILSNTLIAENTAPLSPDVWAAVVTLSDHNLIGDGTGFFPLSSNGDLIGTSTNPIDPLLGQLANNGGPAPTMALLAGSPAIDAGDNNAVASTTDERGYARIVGKAIDIGAYEYGATPATTDLSISGNASSTVKPGGQITYTLIVTNNSSTTAQNNITVIDALPASTTLVSWTAPSGWSSSAPTAGENGSVSAWVASLAANTSATLTLVVQVSSNTLPGAIISNTASVSPLNGDPNPLNNSTTLSTTVVAAPFVTAQPQNQSVLAGVTATFTATAGGYPPPTLQWEVSSDGGSTWTDISGATSTTLTLNNVATAMDNYEYKAIFTNSFGSATTNAATLLVSVLPVLTSNPTNQTVLTGKTATFTAAANGYPSPTVQWEVSTDGGNTFSDIGGATSTTLTVSDVSLAMSEYEYEAVFTNRAGSATTNAATLTVTATIVCTASNVSQLIACINTANADPAHEYIIDLTANSYDLAGVNNTTNGANGLPVITSPNLTIESTLSSGSTIDRNATGSTAFRLLDVATGASLTLDSLTLLDGLAQGTGISAEGGAIYSSGTLNLRNATLESNWAVGGNGSNASDASGGCLYVAGGNAMLSKDTFMQNLARGGTGAPGILSGRACGGGVYVAAGTVSLNNDVLSGNFGEAGRGRDSAGGGVYVAGGDVAMSDDYLSGNEVVGGSDLNDATIGAGGARGGGVFVGGGVGVHVLLSNDTLANNSAEAGGITGSGSNGADAFGGGLCATDLVNIGLINDTFSGNSALGGGADLGGAGGNASGGGLFVTNATVGLVNDTFSSNSAQGGDGGGVRAGGDGGNASGGGLNVASGSTTTLANTLIALNTVTAGLGGTGGPGGAHGMNGSASGTDVSGKVTSSDHDLIGNSSGSSGFSTANGDILDPATVGLDPNGLSPSNGGPLAGAPGSQQVMPTIALLSDSPAIDAGDNHAVPGATDERGYARLVGKAIDIGSYEYFATPASTDLAISGNASSTVIPGGQLTYTLTVTNNTSTTAQNNLTVIDALPADATLVSWTAPSGWSSNAPPTGSSNGTVSAWVDSLAANTSATLTLVVQISNSTPPGTVISNTALVGPLTGDPNPANNRITFTNVVGAPFITTQPQNQTVLAGTTATFTAAADGYPPPTVQWEVSSDGGSTWTDISGATSTTLTLSNVATAMTNYEYKAVFTNNAGSATTNAATLTVDATSIAPSIVADPTNQIGVVGSSLSLTASASGTPTPRVQWRVSTDGGKTFTDISGATNTILMVSNVTLAMSGYEYEAVFTNSAGSATTKAATLTVTSAIICTASNVSQLIACIDTANADPAAKYIIDLTAGSYDLTAVNNTTNGANGLPVITSPNLTIESTLSGGSTIDGSYKGRLFDVAGGASLTLDHLTLQGGQAIGAGTAAEGGAIYSSGTLKLTNVTLKNNQAVGKGNSSAISSSVAVEKGASAAGGGLYVAGGSVTLTNDTINGNFAQGANGLELANTHTVFGIRAGSGSGGGLYIAVGSVSLSNDILSDNRAEGGYDTGEGQGGGIFVQGGSVFITSSMLRGNRALSVRSGTFAGPGLGGGIYVGGGTAKLNKVTLSANEAGTNVITTFGSGSGGGMYVGAASVSLSDDTLFGNSGLGSNGRGGGVFMSGRASGVLTNDTIVANTAPDAGGGWFISTGIIPTLANTLIALNTSSHAPDVFGAVSSSDHDLIGDPLGSNLSKGDSGGDLANYDANHLKLGSLADNGGPLAGAPGSQQVLPTIALLSGSPAIDAGDNNAAPGATDERGYARIVGNVIDIGAYEFGATPITSNLSLSLDPPPGVPIGGKITYTLTATDTGSSDQSNVMVYDVLPDFTTLVAWTAADGWRSSAPAAGSSSGIVSAWIASLAAGASVKFTLVVQVNDNTPIGTVISDTASLGPNTDESNSIHNDSSSTLNTTVIQGAPSLSVRDGGVYNGLPFPAIGIAVGVNGKPVAGSFSYTYYAGSSASGPALATPPINVGIYTVVAAFTSSDPTYTNGVAQTTFTINPSPQAGGGGGPVCSTAGRGCATTAANVANQMAQSLNTYFLNLDLQLYLSGLGTLDLMWAQIFGQRPLAGGPEAPLSRLYLQIESMYYDLFTSILPLPIEARSIDVVPYAFGATGGGESFPAATPPGLGGE